MVDYKGRLFNSEIYETTQNLFFIIFIFSVTTFENAGTYNVMSFVR